MHKIEIHHYHHYDIKFQLAILEKLDLLNHQNKKIMSTLADVQAKVVQLTQKVTDETSVIESAITLIGGFNQTLADIKQQLADAIAQNDPVAMQAVVDSIDQTIVSIDTEKAKLADAVVAGTPAAPAA